MTEDTMKSLRPGDIVRHQYDDHGYVVTGNYGGRITAVQSVDITNPTEWELIDFQTNEVIER